MRVVLVCHESAGDGIDCNQIVRLLELRGCRVLAVTSGDDGDRPLDERADLVVAAGGDGTIGKVAKALAHRPIPMAIIPLGTANNIATSLGVAGTPDELIGKWEHSTRRPLDLGLATGAWGERRTVESLGGGLVAHAITVMDRKPSAVGPKDGELMRALRAYRDLLTQIPVCRWQLRIDGEEIDADYLLVEVLNTGYIGPNIRFSDAPCHDDGRFSVVLAEESHRRMLIDYCDARLDQRSSALALPTRLAQRVEILAADRLHLDDALVEDIAELSVKLTIEAAAVQWLTTEGAWLRVEGGSGEGAGVGR